MSTLKLPLLPLNHGRSRSDSTSSRISHQYQPLSEMPRTFVNEIDTIHESVNKKRKHEAYDSSVYITPTKQAGDKNFQICTPRSKKAKTAPSSPTYSNVYATPKTPKFKSDIPLHNNYPVTSPEFYTTSTVNFSNTVVTPPNSLSGSPKQNISILKVSNVPSTIIPESSFSYPDTCYSFNLTGSTVTKNESNMRSSLTEKQNNEWRSYVVDKVKHENNQSYKNYQTFSSKLKDQEIKKSSLKFPKLNDKAIFPYASKLTDFVQNQYKNYDGLVNYPYASNYSYQTTNYLKEVQKLTSDSELYKRQPKKQNPLQQVDNKIFLPPISELLKVSPIDKTMVHPCALSSSEIKQYNNALVHGIVLERNFKQFNKPVFSHQCVLHHHRLEDNHKVPLPSLNYDLFPDESYIHTEKQAEPILSPGNVEPSIERLDEELKSCKSRQQSFHNSSVTIGKRKTSSTSKTRSRSRSKSRSRSTTPTRVNKPRTRSTSRSKISNSTFTPKTAENTPPASKGSTPQMSPMNSFINIPSTSPSLPLPSLNNTIAAPIAVPLLSTSDFHSKVSVIAPISSSLGSPIKILSHDHINNNGYNKLTASHQKRCISCFSTSSPCWRPSWSAEEGQLCNSCGLRYKKTKARCLNPKCLRIPAKGEWNLMLNRGKVLLNVVDEEGHVVGQTNSYKCLQCDGAMEVS